MKFRTLNEDYPKKDPRIVRDFIQLPVAEYVPSGCTRNYIDAIALDKYALTEFSADMIINATSATPIVNWVGSESGFTITNNDNTIKGYVQDEANSSYFGYRVLGLNSVV